MKTKVEEYLEKERISYEALTFNQTELNDFQKILKQKQ
ncbi:aminoacyl-tRNA deacylase, partial [Enterococcus hirae]|nr:aminoacyl-tRNA deacylase [Enterococcus hirae]EMF0118356.1 aminoacyl-tRNA deacylase [Enterococcus hirae]EMF0155078.1 aminoacyl-tRNA deacylase [Enterococcus hirae]